MSIKISELPVGVPPTGTEIGPFVQAGVTVSLTAQQVANLAPSVTAIRTKLTTNTSYFVTTTGSDVTGDGSAGNPWLTLQHAMDVVSNTLDLAGFQVIVNLAAGSFAGFGVKSIVGGGNLLIRGAGSGLTTITGGPNDGLYNTGEAIGYIGSANTTVVSIDRVKFNPGPTHAILAISTPSVFCFGDFLTFTGADVIFGQCTIAIGVLGPAVVFTAPGVYSIDPGISADSFIYCFYEGQVQLDGVFTIVGTPNYTRAFITVSADSDVFCINVPGPVQFVNAANATGLQFNILNAGYLQIDGPSTALPGSIAGTIDNMGLFIAEQGTHPNYSFNASDSYRVIKRTFAGGQVPTPAVGIDGMIVHIDDAETDAYGAVVSGGGTHHVLAWCHGGTEYRVLGGGAIDPNVNEVVSLFNYKSFGGL